MPDTVFMGNVYQPWILKARGDRGRIKKIKIFTSSIIDDHRFSTYLPHSPTKSNTKYFSNILGRSGHEFSPELSSPKSHQTTRENLISLVCLQALLLTWVA